MQTMMETHLQNKSPNAHNWIIGLIRGPIASLSISKVGLVILKCLSQSLSSKWF